MSVLVLAAIAVCLSVVLGMYLESLIAEWDFTRSRSWWVIVLGLLVFVGAVVLGVWATKADHGAHPAIVNKWTLFIGPGLVGILGSKLSRWFRPADREDV